ncbi:MULTISPECIES: phosphatase PAP2 family protein [unclassified Gordonia (in: high G+C Gram-positive bacteria)]
MTALDNHHPEFSHSQVAARPSIRPVAAATLVASCAALAALAWFALHTGVGQRADQRAMLAVDGTAEGQRSVLQLLGYVSGAAVALVLVCAGIAMARGKVRLGVAAVIVMGGAALTTQILKHFLIERSDLADGVAASNNSFPSGHTTVAAAGLGALLLVSPRRLRLVVVPVGAFAVTLIAAATMVAGWHRASDVIAAILVALAWTALAALVAGGQYHGVRGVTALALVGTAAAIGLLVYLGVRPTYGWSGITDAALVLGAVGVATAGGVALMNRTAPTS